MSLTHSYAQFIERKRHLRGDGGFAPVWMPPAAKPFQVSQIDWAVRQGCAALYNDCGLGKTLMELGWAENVLRHTNRPVLLLTSLAVGPQTVREGEKFGVECVRSADGRVPPRACVVVANYERLHHFDPNDFAGAACDESSILKNFKGATRVAVTEFMRQLPYRLLATATAAPNDYMELGTSAEAIGEMGHSDMLSRFFTKNLAARGTVGWGHLAYKLRTHARRDFWRWVASWARVCRRPSDLGFDDAGYDLPPLLQRETVVRAAYRPPDSLFEAPAVTIQEQRQEQRQTLDERCEAAAAALFGDAPGVAWCHLNDEGHRLEQIIPGAVQVSGADSDEAKEEKLDAFATGQARVLVTKPSVAGFGLNWQHCSRMTTFPSHSFEQHYQSVRRCWRFGQTLPVTVDVITTQGAAGVLANLKRKQADADAMFAEIIASTGNATRVIAARNFNTNTESPSWLTNN